LQQHPTGSLDPARSQEPEDPHEGTSAYLPARIRNFRKLLPPWARDACLPRPAPRSEEPSPPASSRERSPERGSVKPPFTGGEEKGILDPERIKHEYVDYTHLLRKAIEQESNAIFQCVQENGILVASEHFVGLSQMQGGALASKLGAGESTLEPGDILQVLQEAAASKLQQAFRSHKANQGCHTSLCRRFREHGPEYLEAMRRANPVRRTREGDDGLTFGIQDASALVDTSKLPVGEEGEVKWEPQAGS